MANILDVIEQRLANIEAMLGRQYPVTPLQQPPGKQYVYGIGGLARLMKCSLPTAQRIKNSGTVPFTQVGRKIVFDVDAVLAALNKKGGKL